MDKFDFELIKILYENETYVSASFIAGKLDVSTKTIYNRLDKLGILFDKNNTKLVKKPNMGIKLIGDKDKVFSDILKSNNKYFNYSKNYDISLNILHILLNRNSPITIEQLSEMCNCHSRLINNAIDKINNIMVEYNIIIFKRQNIGIMIEGEERSIRKYYVSAILENEDFIALVGESIGIDVNEKLAGMVDISEVILNEKLTKFDRKRLITNLLVMILRNKAECGLKVLDHKIENVNEIYAAHIIKDKIKVDFRVNLNDIEENELTSILISCRRQKNIIEHKSVIDLMMLKNFVTEISNTLDIDLTDDDILIESLLLHLKSAYRRIVYGTKPTNPLLNRIRDEFSDVYLAVLTTIETLEGEAKISFDSNEIGYICLHIVASINRVTSNYTYKVCLVCDAGATISNYLKSMLEAKFIELDVVKTISSSEFSEKIIIDYDLMVFAGAIIVVSNERSIQVSEFLEERDYNIIQNWLMIQGVNVSFNKAYEIADKLLFFQDNLATMEEILIKYGSFLEKHELVKIGYTESLFNREDRAGTALGSGIAAPHGSLDMMLQTTILIVHNKQIINWSGSKVDLCIFIVIYEKEPKNKAIPIRFIHSMRKNKPMCTKLRSAKSLAEVKRIINEKCD